VAHVLVVDNQPDIRGILEIALTELGSYRVSAAATADDALSILRDARPDLVLLDALTPGMLPLEFALDAVRRGIPILVMSGHPGAIETLDQVGCPYLRKPFHLDQLLLECAAAILQHKQNLAVVRAALERLRADRADLARLVRPAQQALDRSRQRPDK